MKKQKNNSYGARIILNLATSLIVVWGLGVPSMASAQNTWSGGGTNNNFSNSANWVSGVAPDDTVDSVYIFQGNPARLQPALSGGNYRASSITFAADAASFTITGVTTTANTRFRTPSSGALTITQNSANDQQIGAILAGSTVIVEGSGAGLLTFGGIRADNTPVFILNRDTAFALDFFTTTSTTRNANFTIGRDSSATATFNSDPFAGISSGTRNIVLGSSINATTGELHIGTSFSTQGNLEVRSGINNTSRRAIISGTGALTLGGNVTFDGNGSRLLEITNSSSGGVTFSGNTILGGTSSAREVTFDVASGSTLSMAMLQDSDHAGSFSQTGNGTIILTGNNSYTGTTTVNAGTLIVNGNQSAATGDTLIASGATLAGTGSLGGEIFLSGTIAPGNSIGQLTVDSLTLQSGATMSFELTNNTAAGTTYDQIVGNELIFADGGSFTLILNGISDTISLSDEFTLFTGSVANLGSANITIVNNTDWAGGWRLSEGSLILTAIPEPNTALFLIIFTMGLVGTRLKRKR
jgi:fibronectin-binding autotransporter adhesin